MNDPLIPHLDRFKSCAEEYKTGNEDKDAMIELKLDHSLRVLDNAEQILEGEGINGHQRTLTRLAALYHDIGRFPQLATYGTFKDRESANHARLGVLTMRQLDLPDGITPHDWKTVRFAIAQHNVRSLRPTVPEHLAAITQVVRDADKLDIYRVMVDNLSPDNPHRSTVIQDVIDEPDKFSDAIYNEVIAKRDGDYRDMRYINDFILLIIGWVYGLHHKTSVSLLHQRGLTATLLDMLPDDPRIEALREDVDLWLRYNDDSSS